MNITGGITSDTPTCVVEELFKSLGYKITENLDRMSMIQSIPNVKIRTVPDRDDLEGFTAKQLSMIACYVNPDTTWDVRKLRDAYTHLNQFNEGEVILMPTRDFVAGQKTKEQPYAYNACMLYKVCKSYGFVTNKTTTMRDMEEIIRTYYRDPDELRESTLNTVKKMSHVELVNLASSNCIKVKMSIPKAPEPEERKSEKVYHVMREKPTQDVISNLKSKLHSVSKLLSRITPRDNSEAIFLAGSLYRIDISESKCPLRQYEEMSKYDSPEDYVPVDDEEFERRYHVNKKWYDIRVTWSPLLDCLYKPEDREMFVRTEGYRTIDIKNTRADVLLNTSRVSKTFYLGPNPGCESHTTTIALEDVRALDSKLVLSYGIVADGIWNMYTPDSLAMHFKTRKAYTDPSDISQLISDLAMNKLARISKYLVNSKESNIDVIRGYTNLLESIEIVKKYSLATSESARKLSSLYDTHPNHVEEILRALLEAGYYMRGWKVDGQNQPPILVNQTQFSASLHDQVDLNVTNAIIALEDAISRAPPQLRILARTLPLMAALRRNGDVVFCAKTSADDGITVMGRIDIVKKGVDTNEESSCIRLSSNYILASAYYYYSACKLDLPFKIEELGNIS